MSLPGIIGPSCGQILPKTRGSVPGGGQTKSSMASRLYKSGVIAIELPLLHTKCGRAVYSAYSPPLCDLPPSGGAFRYAESR
jgi:hypothetical protein